MENVKNKIKKEIQKNQKIHDSIMKKFYKTVTDKNDWGDQSLYQEASKIDEKMTMLSKALVLIEKYTEQ